MSQPVIALNNVSKSFGNFVAVHPTDLEIQANEFFALLGPSGCGKTTLLRMIAGFETPTGGSILIDGQDMSAVAPNKRPVNMVFQSYAVFPHMNVTQNVCYGLRMEGVSAADCERRAQAAMERVGLQTMTKRMPDQLSGGQRQRVALARALVKEPRVLLLDEPLSALDAKLREQMQMELAKLQEDVGVTFIIVTHDQDEALSMADRIAVMRAGNIEQIATPARLYEEPRNSFVADFIGKVNLIKAQVSGVKAGKLLLNTKPLGKIAVPHTADALGDVWLAIRPEKITLKKRSANSKSKLHGTIRQWAYYGDVSHMQVELPDATMLGVVFQNANRQSVHQLETGDRVDLSLDERDMLVLHD